MKKLLLMLAASLFVTSAQADNFTATQTQKRQVQPRKAVIEQPHGRGAVQWALRLDNPAQAISPFAPAEYGDGSNFVEYYEEYDPFQRTPPGKARGHGIKLFSFAL